MAAFNFKARFADLVEQGVKPSTIRAMRKRLPKPGELLHLFTGMRTKSCRKLMLVPCLDVQMIVIMSAALRLGPRWLLYEQRHLIARMDGFKDFQELRDWFRETHGLPFKGFWTLWDPAKAIRKKEDG